MKKFLRALAASLFGILLMSGTASAQTISNGNGTNSTNTITQSNSFNCTVSNNNNITASSSSTQNSSTGNASASGNTTVGNVSTGNASNSSTTTVSVGIINSGAPCLPASIVNPPVTPPPSGGGGGGGQTLGNAGGRGAVLAAGTKITALPETGTTTYAEYAVASMAVMSGLALVLRASTGLRRELAL